jgi:hypothetical protein
MNFCLPGQPYPATYSWVVGPYPPGIYEIELYGYLETTPNAPYLKGTGSVVIARGSSAAPSVVSAFSDWKGTVVLTLALLFSGLSLGRAALRP